MHRDPDPESNPAPRVERSGDERPRYAYPEPLTPEQRADMDRVLPEEVTETHLRWLETGEGEPWDESTD
jgi:hypothetical protein